MRGLTLLLLSLLAASSCLAAKETHQELIDLAAANNGLIPLDQARFDLLTSNERTWSVSIQLTAMDKRRKCSQCSRFYPVYAALAKAWKKIAKSERDQHFFGTVDFDQAPTIFQTLGLNSAPAVIVYPPVVGPRKPANGKVDGIRYDFSNGFDAGPLAAYLSRHTPVPIPYTTPLDWGNVALMLFSVASIVVSLYSLSTVLRNRWTWATLTIPMSMVMNAGFMFTRIRGMPFVDARGTWFAAQYGSQYGQEIVVIASIYAIITGAYLHLTLRTPTLKSVFRQKVSVYGWTFILLVSQSFLLYLFRLKNNGYPFRLLF